MQKKVIKVVINVWLIFKFDFVLEIWYREIFGTTTILHIIEIQNSMQTLWQKYLYSDLEKFDIGFD